MKNWMSIGKTGLIACAFGALLPGCIVTTDDHRGPPPVGTLTVEWTINGGTNPDDCVLYGADHLELAISALGARQPDRGGRPEFAAVARIALLGEREPRRRPLGAGRRLRCRGLRRTCSGGKDATTFFAAAKALDLGRESQQNFSGRA